MDWGGGGGGGGSRLQRYIYIGLGFPCIYIIKLKGLIIGGEGAGASPTPQKLLPQFRKSIVK